MEIKKEILKFLSDNVPQLQGKVFISAAPAETLEPYAIIVDASSDDTTTCDGTIMEGTLDINIYHPKISVLENLQNVIVPLLQLTKFENVKCYYKGSKIEFYEENQLYNKILTIKYF